MAWDHLSINRPHLVYIILGGFTSLFMLCSSFIKERLYIGEATVATICGIIFGPHAANLIDPATWGNTDQITLEFSRIVLVVQCFAVGVELPKYYMEKHWRSVVFLLIPVMTFGWLVTSLFIWWMVLPLTWLEALACAACVTATDPVLASSVVGKGKFAKRVPKHLRDVLSAESGCNDGMAFPFIYLALYLIDYRPNAGEVAYNWIVITILYECVFGAFYGFMVGYIGRHGIKYAEKHEMVDRESFLVFYFVLALFCAGSGSILGVDDLLVGFAAGVGFSNDGWFTQKTEESHVSNVIDLLINLAYFVYLGTIIPWGQYNNTALGLSPWRLVVIALFVIFFRRIPIMLALKPLIPDIKTWREALFAGHFGPIGVGAIFVAILARAELETGETTPLASYPNPEAENYVLVGLIWPITTFLVISSIIVHGSSIAVFTLGKHINTLTLTMSYTQADEPGWLNRLPRISSTSRSQAKSVMSDTDGDELKMPDLPPGALLPPGVPREFLRRQKEEDNPSRAGSRNSSLVPRRRKKRWDDGLGPGGPITQSAIYPQRRSPSEHQSEQTSDTLTPSGSPENEHQDINVEKNEGELGEVQDDPEMHEILHRRSEDEARDQHKSDAERNPEGVEVYQEGRDTIVENEDGEVIAEKVSSPTMKERKDSLHKAEEKAKEDLEHPSNAYKNLRKKLGVWRHKDEPEADAKEKHVRKRGPALAYQFGNTIIIEDEDGEVVKTYEVPSNKQGGGESSTGGAVRHGLTRMGTWTGVGKKPEGLERPAASSRAESSGTMAKMGKWSGFSGKPSEIVGKGKAADDEAEDDRHIRFKMGGAGRRLTKEDFLKEIQSLDPKARCEIVTQSDAPEDMKELARKDAHRDSPGSSRLFTAVQPQMASSTGAAKTIGAEMARNRGAGIYEEEDSSDDERVRQLRSKGRLDLSRRKNAPVKGSTTHASDEPESAAERKRRLQALEGIDDNEDESPERSGRGRSLVRDDELEDDSEDEEGPAGESAAERRRRTAALAGGKGEDSDDDGEERIPPPAAAAARRGIRFAPQSHPREKR